MPQYFDNNPNIGSKRRDIEFEISDIKMTFISDLGVFSKNRVDEGSSILLKVLSSLVLYGKILDVGCGYGTIGLTLLKLFKDIEVDMVDVNNRALELAKDNAKLNSVSERAHIYMSDVYENVKGKFDFIISNPPIRAGKKVTYQIYRNAVEHLSEGGQLIIVIRKEQGAKSVMKYLESIFQSVSLLHREKGYYIILSKYDK